MFSRLGTKNRGVGARRAAEGSLDGAVTDASCSISRETAADVGHVFADHGTGGFQGAVHLADRPNPLLDRYVVTGDGQRFLGLVPVEKPAQPQMSVLVNWQTRHGTR
jgi:hypothetical protein